MAPNEYEEKSEENKYIFFITPTAQLNGECAFLYNNDIWQRKILNKQKQSLCITAMSTIPQPIISIRHIAVWKSMIIYFMNNSVQSGVLLDWIVLYGVYMEQ